MPTMEIISAERSSNLMPSESAKSPRDSHVVEASTAASRNPPKASVRPPAATMAAVNVETSAAMPPARRRKRAITRADARGVSSVSNAITVGE